MNREARSGARSEDAERATGVATRLIGQYCVDADVRVRLVVTEGDGEERIYHFDASSPLLAEQLRVIVRQATPGRWEAVIDR